MSPPSQLSIFPSLAGKFELASKFPHPYLRIASQYSQNYSIKKQNSLHDVKKSSVLDN